MNSSGGGVKGGIRVSIPSGVKKMIENIKEITGQNHSEDEIHAMLKECNMDPNETAQKLLLLETFHEVKRKRDRRKESVSKEAAESKWKPGNQTRTNRAGRGNYPPRYMSHDAGGGRNSAAEKENVTSKAPLATAKDAKKEISPVASQITGVSNGPSGVTSQITNVIHPEGEGVKQSNATGNASMNRELLPSQDLPLPGAAATTQHELGNQRTSVEPIADDLTGIKPASARIPTPEDGIKLHEKISDDIQGVGKNQNIESLQAATSTIGVSVSRPSSNYNNRPQVTGSQKVGAGKEWKPKFTNSSIGQGANTAASPVISAASVGSHSESHGTPLVATSKEETTLELQRKLEESHISDTQHVIIPNHLHVPEVEKLGFSFGSFDAIFALEINQNGFPGIDKSPPLSESSETIDEPAKEIELSSNQNALVLADDTEVKYSDHPQSPSQGPEIFSSTMIEVPSSVSPDYIESKEEVTPGNHQHPMVNTSSNYNFGFMPPILSSQLTPMESSESQARDAPRHPGFVVQQSFDPASYYAQFYRSGMDSDGRISPFHYAGAANKYNGNAAMVSAQTPQTPQELQGGVPLVLSAASVTPLVTQPAGVMQSSITPTQQPLPVFRQPPGVHVPHYNYIPYGPYFSPFYVPPPAIHPFLANGGAFPQQPQPGNLYPTPPPGTTAKYSVSQYKQGSNTGSSGHMGVPGSYGQYGFSMANYSTSSASAAVTPTSNEDLAASQAKENNIYVSGPQNEGSGVWFTMPSRDISTLQASSFYNLPQGHQLAFTPTQPGHGPFPGIFHPTQAVTAATVHPLLQQSQAITSPGDMVGPTGNVYHQQPPPQHAQLNWPSNY